MPSKKRILRFLTAFLNLDLPEEEEREKTGLQRLSLELWRGIIALAGGNKQPILLKDWCCNMGGDGPNHYFTAAFHETHAGTIAALLADKSLADRVEIDADSLTITRYDGRSGGSRAETDLIASLCGSPGMKLGDWSIGYGGQGYSPGTIASGTGAKELLDYLQPRPLPARRPYFPSLEAALRATLAEEENASLFELQTFEARRWMCETRIHYSPAAAEDAARIIRERGTINLFAGMEPFGEEIHHLAEGVALTCHVPFRIAGLVIDEIIAPDPSGITDGFRRSVGFAIQFGYSMDTGEYDNENEFAESQ